MKKLLSIVLGLFGYGLLIFPAFFFAGILMNISCSLFDICLISYDPYKFSTYEKSFFLLSYLILCTLFFYLFHKEKIRLENKIKKGKKLKAFRLHL